MAIPTDIKTKWVNRLRELDGKGMQAKGHLYTNEGKMCCLGVLCEIAVEDGLDLKVTIEPAEDFSRAYNGESNYLPRAVQDWAYLTFNPSFYSDNTMLTLSELNDGGSTFGEIAEIIEKNF